MITGAWMPRSDVQAWLHVAQQLAGADPAKAHDSVAKSLTGLPSPQPSGHKGRQSRFLGPDSDSQG
jgi:hypothetical protein